MLIRTEYDHANRIRLHEIQGHPDPAGVREALETIFASPEFAQDMGTLWDIRQASTDLFSSQDLQSLAGWLDSHPSGSGRRKVALVVSRDVDFGVGRMA